MVGLQEWHPSSHIATDVASWWSSVTWVNYGTELFKPIIIIIIIKDIYITQVRKGHNCAISAEMAVWLRNCLQYYNIKHKCLLKVSSVMSLERSSTGKLFHATGTLTAKLPFPPINMQ